MKKGEIITMAGKDLKNIQVGDMVFVYYQSCKCIKPVQKITPSGLIKVDGNLFNPNGFIRGGGVYCTTYIEIATPEKIEEFRQQIYIKKVLANLKKLKLEDITFEQAERISHILDFRNKENTPND